MAFGLLVLDVNLTLLFDVQVVSFSLKRSGFNIGD